MKYRLMLLVILIFSLSLTIYADNSLWSDKAANLYQDDQQEFKLGDVITVLIEENANAVQSANSDTKQDSNVNAGPGLGIFKFFKAFSFNYADKGSADGKTQRSGTLKADITTQIVDVLPNGNFRINGIKKTKINGEEQVIRLSGIIRPEDITLANTISSKNVAEASIEYEGNGIVAEKQKPGLIERVLNWLF